MREDKRSSSALSEYDHTGVIDGCDAQGSETRVPGHRPGTRDSDPGPTGVTQKNCRREERNGPQGGAAGFNTGKGEKQNYSWAGSSLALA